MNAQKFASDVFEAMGGMVIPLEYALCQVLIPSEFKGYFRGREDMLLAFDYEVAQENPDSEFVTFGSHLMDTLIDLSSAQAVSDLRYSIIDNAAAHDPLTKIKGKLGGDKLEVELLHERPVMGLWGVFTFRIQYVSDEKSEEVWTQWTDLITGKADIEMAGASGHIFYQYTPLYGYPYPREPRLAEAFETALKSAELHAKQSAAQRSRRHILDRELKRIEDYYAEMERENQKALERKGISEDRIQVLHAKHQALLLEKAKQLGEIREKFTIRPGVALDHGVLYTIPQQEYRIRITKRTGSEDRLYYYNPVLKSFRICEEAEE